MRRLASFVVLLTIACGVAGARAGMVENGPLADYVSKEDASYRWVERRTGRVGEVAYAELTLTSQTWRGTLWKHQLFIINPPDVRRDNRAALIYITGGKWSPKYEGRGGGKLPSAAPLFAEVAKIIRTPVVILRHVPQQPLFDGRKEDALIALTFENYLRTGDPEWPLLLPMVKSVVRAMDAVQDYARAEWGQRLEKFTVSGASKRGWTTWLTGAADPRVAAIAPMVIDVLNMEPHIALQHQTFGEPSFKIADYTERGLHEQLDTEGGRALQAIVDPYQYRHQLALPKLIVIGTNDPYWPLDALNLYWDELPGDKRILYVPNQGHSIRDYRRLVGSLNALHQHVARGKRLPELRWAFSEEPGKLRLRVTSDKEPGNVLAWVATSPTRDFREAQWSSHRVERRGGAYEFELRVPDQGFAAIFAEAQYEWLSVAPYYFSTNLRIVGGGAAPAAKRS